MTRTILNAINHIRCQPCSGAPTAISIWVLSTKLSGLSLSLEGGYSVSREIDYKHSGEQARFDPSPYAQVGAK